MSFPQLKMMLQLASNRIEQMMKLRTHDFNSDT